MPKSRLPTTPPQPDDGWIWGNSRGGGGAPLRDPKGHTVANLRAVVRGEVEVDYSPSNSPTRRAISDNRDANFGSSKYNVRHNSRGVDDEYDHYDSSSSRVRGGGRKSVAYADENDDINDVPFRRKSGRGFSGGKGGRDFIDTVDHERSARARGGRSEEYDYVNNLGGNDHGPNGRRPERVRARSPIEIDTGSPKKFMNSLRTMNTSALPTEQAAKAKKELEYQAQLRQQIEEKKRKKEEDERKSEDIKKKELEEYLRIHYKGKIPDHVLQKLPSNSKDKNDRSLSFERENDESIYNVGRKAAGIDDNDFGDDNDMPPKNRGKPMKSVSRAQFENDNDSDFDPPDHDYDGGSRGRKAIPHRRHDRDDLPPRDKWVSQTEYDELSALCDKLLLQQDTLQSELRNQAKLLKTISKPTQDVNSRSSRGVSPAMRARSVQNGAKRPPMPPPGPASASKASAMGRPSSIHTASRIRTGTDDLHVPKVAFGRAVDEKAPTSKKSSVGGVDAQKRSIVRAGGAATGKLLMRSDTDASAAAQQQRRGRGASPARPSARDASPAGGFGKLQQVASKVNGPLVVSYDEDGRELKGSTQKRGGGNAMRSLELTGESEYLRIGGEEVDIISGDQLDRLLAQARKVRGGR